MKCLTTTLPRAWLPVAMAACLCANAWAQNGPDIPAAGDAAAPAVGAPATPESPAPAPELAPAPAPAETGSETGGAPAAISASDAALESLRDPFWPIGWKPAPVSQTKVNANEQPKGPIRWDEATRMLILTSLVQLPQGGYLATLKGIGVVEPGDKIAVNYGGLTYHWEVRSITEKGIVPRRLGVSSPRGN